MSFFRKLQIREGFRKTGSILDSKKTRRRHEVTEDKLDEIGAALQRSQKKKLGRPAEQTDIIVCTSPRYGRELLRLYLLCSITIVRNSMTDRETRLHLMS